MVLAAIVSLVFLTISFGKKSIISFGDEYTITVRFERAPGINKNSPVLKNGVPIGRVSKVELVDGDREVELSVLLPRKRKIYTDEICRIRQTVIMGEASLEFVKIPNFKGEKKEIDPDMPIAGSPPTDLLSGFSSMEGDLTKAINHVSDAAVQMGEFIDRANTFIGTPEEMKERRGQFDVVLNESRLTMSAVREFSEGANRFVNDPKLQADMKRIIENMPDLLDRSRKLLDEAQLFVKDGRSLMEKGNTSLDKIDRGLDKAENALDGVVKITDSMQGNVPEFMESLKKSAKKLESFLDELTSIVEAVNNADGTIKKLMRDPEMYEKLLKTVDNVEQLTAEVNRMLRTDVKPIANNVKVLTDKAARDPSIFIRNLIRKQPPTKGALPIWGDGLGSDSLGDLSCSLDSFNRETMYFDFENPASVVEPYDSPTLAPQIEPQWDDSTATPPSAGNFRMSAKQKRGRFLPFSMPSFFSKTTTKTTEEIEPTLRWEPLALGNPSHDARRLPEEGVIICVDPRYALADGSTAMEAPVYRQMSHVEKRNEEPEVEPQLKFAAE